MYKAVFFILVLCLACYIPFSREPDYMDSNIVNGIVVSGLDSSDKKLRPFVQFTDATEKIKDYRFNPHRNLAIGQKIKVIYDSADPKRAAVYSFWGYWLSWKELLALVIGYFVLLELAKAITHNPHPDAIKELEDEENKPKIRRPKYGPDTF